MMPRHLKADGFRYVKRFDVDDIILNQNSINSKHT